MSIFLGRNRKTSIIRKTEIFGVPEDFRALPTEMDIRFQFYKSKNPLITSIGKVSVITCIFYLFSYFKFLIDVFFDVDSKSTIGFWRSHVVFELWRFKITRKICKKIQENENFLFNYKPNLTKFNENC